MSRNWSESEFIIIKELYITGGCLYVDLEWNSSWQIVHYFGFVCEMMVERKRSFQSPTMKKKKKNSSKCERVSKLFSGRFDLTFV